MFMLKSAVESYVELLEKQEEAFWPLQSMESAFDGLENWVTDGVEVEVIQRLCSKDWPCGFPKHAR